jgi:nucleotide-binding universal stress UspA family protein
MREFKTILCATDFSEASYHALEYAVRFARLSDAVVILAHIVHVPAGDLLGGEAYTMNFEEAQRQVRERLDKVRAEHLQNYPKCELVTTIGDPSAEILSIAKDRRVDLIITATHGRSGFKHLVMGGVADKIIRHAPCPVFVVRAGVE